MERTNEEQLELFAELIDPLAEIMGDKELSAALTSGKAPIRAVKPAILNHKSAVITLLAVLDGVRPAEYRVPGPGMLLMKVVSLFARPEIKDLFTLQGQIGGAESSGPATGSIGGGAV